MKIRDIMTIELGIAEPEDTLDEIAAMMRDQDVGAIPVVEEGELIGIVTDRDIVVRCIAEGKDPSDTAVDEIITGDVQTIEPNADLEQARHLMAEKQIRRLPVVENGQLVGMVSLGDLAVKADENEAADTLEEISEGVKATDQSAARKSGGRMRGAGEGQLHGRQQTMDKQEHHQASQPGRIEEQDKGMVDRKQKVGNRQQGIASHSAQEEVARQDRVVPIRTEQKTSIRSTGKSSSRRKTG